MGESQTVVDFHAYSYQTFLMLRVKHLTLLIAEYRLRIVTCVLACSLLRGMTLSFTGQRETCFKEVRAALCGPGSVFVITTGYGLDGPGIESR
jgi:hypothetical protein